MKNISALKDEVSKMGRDVRSIKIHRIVKKRLTNALLDQKEKR
jgi:hypothetical protein